VVAFVRRYLGAPSAWFQAMIGMRGNRGLGGLTEQAVAFEERGDGVGG
jgi:hypothetical protein